MANLLDDPCGFVLLQLPLGIFAICAAAAIRSMLWRSFRHHLLIAFSALETKELCPSDKLLVRVLLARPSGKV
jgi:hypothetical protein